MSSLDALTLSQTLSPHAVQMIGLARSSIRYGLAAGEALPVSAPDFPAGLRQVMASFVTLRIEAELRGCIGTVLASRPLAEDVSHNAFMAAFRDPRFDPLAAAELGALRVEISVLGPPAPLAFESEDALIAMLVPGRDGLILEKGEQRGLFLPQVWETLPDPADFLRHLKEKAGLPDAPLAAGSRAQRFFVAKFAEGDGGL
jgi:AmmeMemoRadiSam system protein A